MKNEIKEILTESEREYLSSIIKPFRDRVISFCKINYDDCVKLTFEVYFVGSKYKADYCSLPKFDKKTMFTGMKPYKEYTLEELGL